MIAERRAGLKRMNEHLEAMAPVVRARGDVAGLVPRIDDMVAWFQGFPTRFPPGSDRGDTKALPTVWTERPGFDTANANLLRHLDALRVAAAAGDTGTTGTLFATTGREFCGGCHRNYRAR